jgi:hypothetical protein
MPRHSPINAAVRGAGSSGGVVAGVGKTLGWWATGGRCGGCQPIECAACGGKEEKIKQEV